MSTVNFLGISIVGQSNQVITVSVRPSTSALSTFNTGTVNFLGISIVGQSNQVITVSILTSTS
jgi:hypothetical protein